jgi:prefoldin subunit 5
MPANDAGSLVERVQSSYERLTAVASDLNSASDELGQSIAALDESLKSLNLGITRWHKFDGDENENGFWAKYIGYARIGSKWGISLSSLSGPADDSLTTDDEWLFNDAPRQLRIEAVRHIPAMINTLVKAAEETVENIRANSTELRQLAKALAAKPKAPRTAPPPVPPPGLPKSVFSPKTGGTS